jgi:hypothetical protein
VAGPAQAELKGAPHAWRQVAEHGAAQVTVAGAPGADVTSVRMRVTTAA